MPRLVFGHCHQLMNYHKLCVGFSWWPSQLNDEYFVKTSEKDKEGKDYVTLLYWGLPLP